MNFKGKKVFISQAMRGLDEATIRKEREEIVRQVEQDGGEVIDSVLSLEVKPEVRNVAVFYLGHALALLATADLAIFTKGWENQRGCKLEHDVCEKYDIPTFEM